MSDRADTLTSLLTQYGLTSDEARIYLLLLEKRPLSALAISRILRISRGRVYRLADKLMARGLVVQKLGELGLVYDACDPEVLTQLVSSERHRIESVASHTPEVISRLVSLVPQAQSRDTKIRYYSGAEGLRQVTLHSLAARGHLCIYEAVNDMNSFIDREHAEWIREKLVENEIRTYQLTNFATIKPFTNVIRKVTDFWEVRHIRPERLTIAVETLLYNDTYALYSVERSEMFCVEITNDQVARMQQQLFWYIWSTAQSMTITDPHGAASLAPL